MRDFTAFSYAFTVSSAARLCVSPQERSPHRMVTKHVVLAVSYSPWMETVLESAGETV